VPTGMNAGVSTSPWAVVITPRRAPASACVTRKLNDRGEGAPGWDNNTC